VESYLRQNFAYVQPTTVKLGSGSFQYVSVRETLEKVRADKTFQTLRKPRNICEDDTDGFLLEDVEDGLNFKENKFFQKHPDAMRLEKIPKYHFMLQILGPKGCFQVIRIRIRIIPFYAQNDDIYELFTKRHEILTYIINFENKTTIF
jgi:hypothetical protein